MPPSSVAKRFTEVCVTMARDVPCVLGSIRTIKVPSVVIRVTLPKTIKQKIIKNILIKYITAIHQSRIRKK